MSTAKRLIAVVAAVFGMVLAAGLALAASSDAAPYTNPATCSVSTSTPAEGSSLTVGCSNFGANDSLSIDLHTAVTHLATVTSDQNGSISAQVTLPAGVTGSHTIVVSDAATGQVVSVPITIGGAATPPPGSSSGGSGGLSNTGVAVIGVGALGLVLLIGGGLMLLAGKRRKVTA